MTNDKDMSQMEAGRKTNSDTKTLQMDTGCQITSYPKLSQMDARRLTVYHKKLSVNAYIQLFCDKNIIFKAHYRNLSKAPIAFCISYRSKDSFKYGMYMFSSTVFQQFQNLNILSFYLYMVGKAIFFYI